MTLRIGELFAGYGGLGLGIQAALGGVVSWVSEIEPGPSRILAGRLGVPNLGDIRSIDWAAVEPVDILSGGFPCQDVSTAGLRRGIRPGTRSGLWAEFARAIDALRPRMVVIENVRGLLSANAHSDVESCPWCVGDVGTESALRALGAVLGDLADIGYDAAWRGLRARDVGAPHNRFRIFIVAYPSSFVVDGRGLARHGSTESANRDRVTPDADGIRLEIVGRILPVERHADRRSRAESMTGALLPTPVAAEGHSGVFAPFATISGQQEFLTNAIAAVHDAGAWGPYAEAVARWEAVTGRPAPSATMPDGKGGRHRLNARLVEWMMGLPDGWVTDPALGLSRIEQLKALGNGVVPLQAEAAIRALI